ncbi:Protein phosphatase 1F [Blyttiomyces sp. JEL0837]|nr:Protein phosphatase 1F [Blyttiomyces sp. JEL0837]
MRWNTGEGRRRTGGRSNIFMDMEKMIEKDELEGFCLHAALQQITSSDEFSNIIVAASPSIQKTATEHASTPLVNPDEEATGKPAAAIVSDVGSPMSTTDESARVEEGGSGGWGESDAKRNEEWAGLRPSRSEHEFRELVRLLAAKVVADRILIPKRVPRRKSLFSLIPKKNQSKPTLYEREVLMTELDDCVKSVLSNDIKTLVEKTRLEPRKRGGFQVDAVSYRGIKATNEDRIISLPSVEPILVTDMQFAPTEPDRSPNSSGGSLTSDPSSPSASTGSLNAAAATVTVNGGVDTLSQTPPSPRLGFGSGKFNLKLRPASPSRAGGGQRSAQPSPGPGGVFSDIGYFAVYDGHGGENTAEYIHMYLHVNILTHPKFPTNVPVALREGFVATNERFKRCVTRENQNTNSGSTATVAVIEGNNLHVAWAGDSPAFLIMESGEAEMLIKPHNASVESERRRLEAQGGVFLRDNDIYRLNGSVTVTKSFGDLRITCMSAEPDVITRPLTGKERYLVVASDGLTDVMDPVTVGKFIRDREALLDGNSGALSPARAAGEVGMLPVGVAEAIAQEAVDNKGSMDNVSVIVVRLH